MDATDTDPTHSSATQGVSRAKRVRVLLPPPHTYFLIDFKDISRTILSKVWGQLSPYTLGHSLGADVKEASFCVQESIVCNNKSKPRFASAPALDRIRAPTQNPNGLDPNWCGYSIRPKLVPTEQVSCTRKAYLLRFRNRAKWIRSLLCPVA